ncbi:MAG: NAD-dependent succinate-semialdehyde dehydrogenase [Candidatus Aminicenantales bacterium]
MKSINPATGKEIREYREHSSSGTSEIIRKVHLEWQRWKETSFEFRADKLRMVTDVLRRNKELYARLMTEEMGKIIRESLTEVEKCANCCDYYADHAGSFLTDRIIPSDAGKSFVTYEPMGVILAVMPWNFPFWQVIRFAAPALMAGNAALLKHASNVPGCAVALEEIFREAGLPENLFRTLIIPSQLVEEVISNPLVSAVTLTGSEQAGSRVAAAAGKNIKKSVLELGGSDPFIVLDDADLEKAVKTAVVSRMINQGQSCIAAKRFIVHQSRIDEFTEKLQDAFENLKTGDPSDPGTDVGPLARQDLVDEIDSQVKRSLQLGARLVTGGRRPDREGFYYLPTMLSDITPEMPVFNEETFGPVAAIIAVKNDDEAICVANDSEFGLGGSIWTADKQRGEALARKIKTGSVFVNGLMKSDPRLPFGGVKKSGYGRELSDYGIREFVNIKTIWIE